MRSILSFFILLITGAGTFGQNLIGYNENEIRSYMKENHKEMIYNIVVNSSFRYLKYSNSSDNQTLLFFLNPESVSKSVRLICDKSIIPEKIKEFNSIYIKNGENSWIDKHDGKNYIITSKEEEWSFIVSMESEK